MFYELYNVSTQTYCFNYRQNKKAHLHDINHHLFLIKHINYVCKHVMWSHNLHVYSFPFECCVTFLGNKLKASFRTNWILRWARIHTKTHNSSVVWIMCVQLYARSLIAESVLIFKSCVAAVLHACYVVTMMQRV